MQPESLATETEAKPDLKLGNADLDITVLPGGKVRLEVKYDGKGVDGGAFVEVEASVFAEKLKAAIPGKIDDVIIDGLLKAIQ